MAAASPAPHRRRRTQAELRHSLSRALVVWTVSVIVLSFGIRGTGTVALHTLLVTVVYAAAIQWAWRLAHQMPLAFGVWIVAAIGATLGFIAMSAVDLWIEQFSRNELVFISVLTFCATGLWEEFVRRKASAPVRVVVVGSDDPFTDLLETVGQDPEGRGFKIVGVAAEDTTLDVADPNIPIVDQRDLGSLVAEAQPDLIVVAVSQGRPAVFSQLLALASSEDFTVLGVPEFYEVAFGRLPVRTLTPAWFMSTLHYYNRPYNRVSKRMFDVVVALFGLIFAAPILPFVALIVKRTPGPLLYRQQRLGEHGKPFSILKFRSMQLDAESDGTAVFASERDPRIIPGGRLLRLWRLDEIPQLWNVLRGEMSIVGPRPERPEFLRLLAEQVPFWTQRELLKPGLTGWAQIRAGYSSDALGAETKLSYDLWYLRHRSLLLDAVICLKTVGTVATGSGSR